MTRVRRLSFVLLTAAMGGFAQEKPAVPAPVSLRELSVSLEHLSNHVRASVVQIFSTGYAPAEASEGSNNGILSRQKSTGSGVVISADGYIVTNSHVVRGARRIQVRFLASRQDLSGKRSAVKPEGRTLDARIVGMDRESDLALVKVEGTGFSHLRSEE